MATTKPPQLKVVFDTSILHIRSASSLLNGDSSQLIEENSRHKDLEVSWYLPSTVVNERNFQMKKAARKLFPTIAKLEKLLGHNLNITDSIVDSRIEDVIKSQLEELNISVIALDYNNIDWADIAYRAEFRFPPFEDNDKEKGFRDALIAEAFIQLAISSPKTPSRCRLALVTADKLLTSAVQERTSEYKNLRFVASLEELGSLINTLVSEVTESFVSKISDQADDYFYDPETEGGLYKREDVLAKIVRQFSANLNELPEGASFREHGSWWINNPKFVRKDGQKVYWNTRITIESTAYARPAQGYVILGDSYSHGTSINRPAPWTEEWLRVSPAINIPSGSITLNTETPSAGGTINTGDRLYGGPAFVAPGQPLGEKRIVATGRSKFDVSWSFLVSTKGNLSRGKIETIEFSGTTWDE